MAQNGADTAKTLTHAELRIRKAVLLLRFLSLPSSVAGAYVTVYELPATLTTWGWFVVIVLMVNTASGLPDIIYHTSKFFAIAYKRILATLTSWEVAVDTVVARIRRVLD